MPNMLGDEDEDDDDDFISVMKRVQECLEE